MIREATAQDLPALLDIGERFHKLSPWRDRPYSPQAVVDTLARMTASPDAVVLFNGTGALGGMVAPTYFGGGLVAQELFWFADKSGRELLDGFEEWARDKGACGVAMISLAIDERTDSIMGKVYERRGYGLRERTYFKEIA